MALASTTELIINITGLASGGTKNADTTVTTAFGGPLIVTLAAGFNSIAVPTGATRVAIYPPAGNAQTITLKGITGDTGTPLSKTQFTELGLDVGVTTIGLTAGGTVTNLELIFR